MSRREELINIVCKDGSEKDAKVINLIDEIIFLETNLQELKKLPFITVNPKNNTQQKATAASKQYKELLQQYTNCMKLLFNLTNKEDGTEESPLRAWARNRKEME